MRDRLNRLLCFVFDHPWLYSNEARYDDGRGASIRFCSRCGRFQLQTHGDVEWYDATISAAPGGAGG